MTGLRRAALAAAVASVALLGGCAGGVLDPQGPVGAQERTVLLDALGVMLAIVVPTILAVFAFAWWFRASNRHARYQPEFVYSGRIEVIVWAIPTMVVLFLGGIIWIGSHRLDPAAPLDSKLPPLEVQVVSLDWKWLFIYPQQGVASVNRLVVPVGTPVHFSLTSASVMNTFFVPQLGGMIYTMNGMSTQLSLQADKAGDYLGRSGHFSGDGFSNMAFTVHAAPPAEFAAWAAAAHAAGPALDRAAYATLSRQDVPARPYTFSAVEPGLYDRVVAQAQPPGPGPAPSAEPKQPVRIASQPEAAHVR